MHNDFATNSTRKAYFSLVTPCDAPSQIALGHLTREPDMATPSMDFHLGTRLYRKTYIQLIMYITTGCTKKHCQNKPQDVAATLDPGDFHDRLTRYRRVS
jgi:hypothetical protein